MSANSFIPLFFIIINNIFIFFKNFYVLRNAFKMLFFCFLLNMIAMLGGDPMKYVVQSWETWKTLDMIASRFGVTADQMIAANPVLNSVPAYPGMILEIPGHDIIELPTEGYVEYVVQPDDTFYNIGHRFKLDYQRIIAQNPQIENPNEIWPGEIIYLIYLGY